MCAAKCARKMAQKACENCWKIDAKTHSTANFDRNGVILFSGGSIHVWATMQYVCGGVCVDGAKFMELLLILCQNEKRVVSLVSRSSGTECEAWRLWART